MTQYDLNFDIDPDLYKRAVTQPITPERRKARKWKELRNFIATIGFCLGVYMLGQGFFPQSHILALPVGAVIGAGLVLIIWWRQHRTMVRLHSRYNDSAGRQHMTISADHVIARRPGIESKVEWSFVQTIWSIDGATLIDLGTARLIVPDTALPDGVSQSEFVNQLQTWKDTP